MTITRSRVWRIFATVAIASCVAYVAFAYWLGTRITRAVDRLGRAFVHADGHAIVAPAGSVVVLDGHVIARVTQIAGARFGAPNADSLMLFLGVFSDSSAAAQVRGDSTLIAVLPPVTDWSQPIRMELTHLPRANSGRAWGRVFLDPTRVVMSVYVPDVLR
jgi:hypothetical protein